MGGGKKTSDSDDFHISGPKHLAVVDWDNSDHQTAVTASLVQGVYTMQRDKAKERKPLAKPWWEFFGFSLDKHLINEADDSIYGAVFKYDYNKNTLHSGIPPLYVIAFRGIMLSLETGISDLKQALRCIANNLDGGKRFENAKKAIKTVLSKPSSSKTTSVWLAGHSLGAGMALLAGKSMARSGFLLETYAFNPPHSSIIPLEQISSNDVLKAGIRLAGSLSKATLAWLTNSENQEDDPGTAAWIPYLYVNPADIICAEYIGDSKFKNIMSVIGLSKLESAADRFSSRSLFFEGEGIQLLSAAHMKVNKNESTDFKTAHGLEQWWEPDPARRVNWEDSDSPFCPPDGEKSPISTLFIALKITALFVFKKHALLDYE